MYVAVLDPHLSLVQHDQAQSQGQEGSGGKRGFGLEGVRQHFRDSVILED